MGAVVDTVQAPPCVFLVALSHPTKPPSSSWFRLPGATFGWVHVWKVEKDRGPVLRPANGDWTRQRFEAARHNGV